MNKKMKKMNNQGFSLIELIVVIAIMAILAVTLAPRLTQYIERSRKASDREAINSIYTAARLANAEYPLGASKSITLDGTIFTVNASGTRKDWTLNSSYTYASNQDFVDTMIEALSSFKLKSNDASSTSTITLKTDADGYLTVGLDYTPVSDDSSTLTVDESADDIVVSE